jgi:hypothetical protein
MAEIRTPRSTGRAPWGWILGLIVLGIATIAIIWWLRAGAPPAGTTGQEGVEQRVEPGQPGLQPQGPGMAPPTQPQPTQPQPTQPQPTQPPS